ncbi:MAG TPA: hypothetical protein VFX59_22880, partial [Polyangiales bacterium]|nr:hypothetical protein [Polyangiales bacterium]
CAQRELDAPLTPRSAPWLELIAAYGEACPKLERALIVDDRRCMVAGLQLAAARDPRGVLAWVERLLTFPDADVQDQALRAALIAHSARGWEICRTVALQDRAVNAVAIQLFGALGGASACVQLEPLLASPAHREDVLFAFGASGCSEVIPTLMRQIGEAGRSAKVAFEAFSTLTGLDTADRQFVGVERDEDDDGAPLDTSLHERAADLYAPSVDAVARWWSERSASLSARARWLGGQPFTLEAVRSFLLDAPLRRRHLIADVLRVHVRGSLALDTRARPARQRAQLAALRPVPLHNPYAAG